MRTFDKKSYDYDIARGIILSSPRFGKYKLKTADIPKRIKADIWNYLENFEVNFKEGYGLYFVSKTPGSGKTTIMTAVLKHLMEKGFRAYFNTFIEIKNELKKEFDIKEKRMLEMMKVVDILAVDDIGSETMSNWLDEVFKEILDYRYNQLKPTFFTSNVLIEHLPFLNKSKDRLKEISIVMEFPEKSLRKKPLT